jgi:hypothetical protein
MNSTTISFKLIIDNCSHLQKEDVKNSLGKRKSKTLLQPMCEWRERVDHKKLWFKEKWRKESGVET